MVEENEIYNRVNRKNNVESRYYRQRMRHLSNEHKSLAKKYRKELGNGKKSHTGYLTEIGYCMGKKVLLLKNHINRSMIIFLSAVFDDPSIAWDTSDKDFKRFLVWEKCPLPQCYLSQLSELYV